MEDDGPIFMNHRVRLMTLTQMLKNAIKMLTRDYSEKKKKKQKEKKFNPILLVLKNIF